MNKGNFAALDLPDCGERIY